MHLMWGASVGFVDEQGDPILPSPGNEGLVQLIHSPDGFADPMLPGGAPAGNDAVLYVGSVQNNGGAYDPFGVFGPLEYQNNYVSGSVYGVICENTNPQAGDRYYAGPLQTTVEDTGAGPETYELNINLVDGNTWNRTVAGSLSAQVSWSASFGFTDEGGNPILPVLGNEAAIQLIYSPDGVRDPILPGGVPADDDVVLASGTVRNNGGVWENYGIFGPLVYDGPYQPGSLYGIIYQDTNPQAEDRYFAGPLQTTALSVSYDMNAELHLGNAWNGSVISQDRALDVDEDGMPNDFEKRHFDSLTLGEANVDSDLDGSLNGKEYIADTNPNDDDSFFGVDTISSDQAGTVIILRDTSMRRDYVVECNDRLSGSTWTPVDVPQAGTGGDAPVTDPGGAALPARTYRGNVLLPQ